MSKPEDNAKPPQPIQVATDAELIRQNEMLKVQLATRETQLRQAVDIGNRANEVKKATEEAERQSLIDLIVIDTNGEYTKDQLKDTPLADVRLIKTTVDRTVKPTFVSIAAHQADEARKKKPLLTAGYWDRIKGEWAGGI